MLMGSRHVCLRFVLILGPYFEIGGREARAHPLGAFVEGLEYSITVFYSQGWTLLGGLFSTQEPDRVRMKLRINATQIVGRRARQQ